MQNKKLKEILISKCKEMDIPLVGFAPASSWDQDQYSYIPIEERPERLLHGAKTAIVIGIPIHLPVLETAPSVWYHEVYKTVNAMLDQSAYRLATFLGENGWISVSLPRDGYPNLEYLKQGKPVPFSHRHAAVMAGLGTFGVNNTVLTPEYGPRVRFATILTTAEISDFRPPLQDQCTHCMKCVHSCPVSAFDGKDYPASLMNKDSCIDRSMMLRQIGTAPCGICIAVCPVGQDRINYVKVKKNL